MKAIKLGLMGGSGMKRISIEEAGTRLAESLTQPTEREPVVIVKDDEPIALLVPIPRRMEAWHQWPIIVLCGPFGDGSDFLHESFEQEKTPPGESSPEPVFGSCKRMLTVISEDDEHLKDFEEYMR
jgi:antitoxin (DNA-binding transcriptional repressor) of toxin-antitoxin stability system